MEKFLLGLDIGTTDIKAVLFNLKGEEIEICRKKNRLLLSSNGRYEQDMDLLWESTCAVIKELLQKTIYPADHIVGIGFSAQGEGCWLVDAAGKPVRSAILWNDVRSAYLIDELDSQFTAAHKRITGSNPGPGGTNFILKWLSINDRQSLDQAKYCFFCKDWIRYKLSGVAAVEKTDMSTSLLDLGTQQLSTEMFDLLGIPEYSSLIPPLLNSHDIAGKISKAAAAATGLAENTPIAAGYIDVVATGMGVGAVYENEVCSIMGTSCVNEYVSKTYNTFEGSAAYLCHGDSKNYFCLIGTMAGTPNIDWINGALFSDVENILGAGEERYNYIDKKIQAIPIGSQGVIYHPYIKTSGERAPFLDINARANFFGVNEHTNRWHLLRAVYEGLAFSMKDCFQSYRPSKIFLTGGGSNSPVLVQIISDCMGVPVCISSSKELGAKGAALGAGIATGIFSRMEEAVAAFQSTTKEFTPNKEHTAFYQEYFELYKELRSQYQNIWKVRKNILEKFNIKEDLVP